MASAICVSSHKARFDVPSTPEAAVMNPQRLVNRPSHGEAQERLTASVTSSGCSCVDVLARGASDGFALPPGAVHTTPLYARLP
eukprot:2999393-Prymnesium_polylepis.1